MVFYHLFVSVFISLFFSTHTPPEQHTNEALIPETVCLSPYEAALYEALNKYRQKHRLPEIALSKSLTLVAQAHRRDLEINQPHSKRNCNMHSWSDKGPWTSCCYTADHKRASCMWNKPAELTVYKSDGFEISFWSTRRYTSPEEFATDAIEGWSRSQGHNDIMVNRNTWKKFQWKAVGIGHFGEYACIWFGAADDPDKTVVVLCD